MDGWMVSHTHSLAHMSADHTGKNSQPRHSFIHVSLRHTDRPKSVVCLFKLTLILLCAVFSLCGVAVAGSFADLIDSFLFSVCLALMPLLCRCSRCTSLCVVSMLWLTTCCLSSRPIDRNAEKDERMQCSQTNERQDTARHSTAQHHTRHGSQTSSHPETSD